MNLTEVRRILVPWALATCALALLPLAFPSGGAITIMNQMAITIVFALSYNMLLGQAGMLSFGHAVYMGMGGFACFHLMNHAQAAEWPIPLPAYPLFAGLFSMGLAAVIGAFSVRRSGAVFAMISLGVVELIASAAIIIYVFFRGGGAGGDRTLGPTFFGVDFAQQVEVYYLVIFWLIVAIALMRLFTLTPLGRIAEAARDNPERAEFIGYSTYWVRFHSFCFAGFFAGVAGGLFAITYEITTAENLGVQASGAILMIAFLGGVGSFWGPILGAVAFTLIQTVLSFETELWRLYLGALFVAMVMFCPGGLAALLDMHLKVLKAGWPRALTAPYLASIASVAIAAISVALIAEIFLHRRTAAVGEDEMTLLRVSFDSDGDAVVIGLSLCMIGGVILAGRVGPKLISVWREATSTGAPHTR